MKKKKEKSIKVSFVGPNAEEVTGSMVLVEFNETKILLEGGLFQSNDIKRDYSINSRNFRGFKPKEIDYIFIGHVHADHSLLLPRLYKEGCRAKIIAPHGSSALLKIMGYDSAYIISKDTAYLSKIKGKIVPEIYTKDDVDNMLEYILEFQVEQENSLSKDLKFKFIPSGHIINAAQIVLEIKNGNKKRKILYTSDLGNISVPKPYTSVFRSARGYFDLVIGESTYGNRPKTVTQRGKNKELQKLKTVISDTMLSGGKVLIPTFSLDRTQHMLTEIYKLFKDDKSFKYSVIVDSPLACKISSIYGDLLKEEDKNFYQNVFKWKNVTFISSYEDSCAQRCLNEPCIILSSPGFISKGRSLEWTKTLISDPKNYIVTCGYFPENSLLYKIKNSGKTRLKIDDKIYKNNIKIFSLSSFSSHAQQKDLINYYSKLKTNKIVLVHGSTESKLTLKKEIETKRQKESEPTTVFCASKNLLIKIK